VVGVGHGRPEERHDAVAHDLVHGAARFVHGRHQALDHLVQHLARLFEIMVGQ